MQPTRRSTVPSLSAGILTNDITGNGLEKRGAIGLGNAAVTSTQEAAAAAATATTSIRRLSNTTASLPIVYGSIAFFLGRKADEFQTHKWTLFLRGPNKHDDHLSSLVISKVVFQLHPSFAKATRELTEPPYEVTERGWGEFEAQIHIHWKDPTEQTTILNHTIKLYPQGTPPTISSSATATANNNTLMQQSTEKPVLAETYDEAVFTDPTESFFQLLTQITAITKSKEEEEAANVGNGNGNDNSKSNKEVDKTSSRNISSTLKDQQQPSSSLSSASVSPSSWRNHLNIVYSDQEDFLALIGAQKFLQDELSKVKRRFQIVNDEITVVDQKLVLVQQQKQREAAVVAVNGASHTAPVSSSGERKRTKKSRSTSQSKKARNISNNKGMNVNATASVPGVTTSAKSTTAATAAANRRKPITTTTTTTKKIATTSALASASASASAIPLPAPIAATKIASSSIAADSATTAITTTNSNSNSNTKAINKG